MIASEAKSHLKELLCECEGGELKARVIFETVSSENWHDCDGDISENDFETMCSLAQRVMEGYPIQYVAGSWPFMDFEVQLGEGVLIPRDDTCALVEAVFSTVEQCQSALDLCAGTGIIGIALARHYGIPVTQVELHDAAFEYLKINTCTLAPDNRTVQADVFSFQNEIADGFYDIIVSNPPYVTEEEYLFSQPEIFFEPKQALVGGLDFYRHIIPEYRRCLRPGGTMAFEIGCSQTNDVLLLFRQAGFEDIRVYTDLEGMDRAIIAKRPLL